MRGRKSDHPALQAAKGNPGKRRSKIERQIARAEEVAALLTASPAEALDPFAPPPMLADARCAAALAVWRDLVPQLARVNLYDVKFDRYAFAMFCIWVAEFTEADLAIRQEGYSRLVLTVSRDLMPRINPNVDRRAVAFKFVLEGCKRFGLTALDRFNLMSTQRSVLSGLGAGAPALAPAPDVLAGQPAGQGSLEIASPIGALDGFDAAPPVRRSH